MLHASIGKHSGDATTKVSSSISLLQERFRRLQKAKEKREEKELLKMLLESETMSPTGHFEPSNLPFQSNKMVLPRRHRTSTSQDQLLSLGFNFQANLWSNSTASTSSSKIFENSDIDTSLHL